MSGSLRLSLTTGQGLPEQRFAITIDGANTLHYFSATMTVPHGHQPGAIERPKQYFSYRQQESTSRHITLAAIDVLGATTKSTTDDGSPTARWLRELAAEAASRKTKRALILIGGMGNSLPTALFRLTQIAEDTNLSAVPVACVWAGPPTGYDPRAYTENRNRAEQSTPGCQKLIDLLLASAFEEVVIIGFSMGAHVTVGAISPLFEAASRSTSQVLVPKGGAKSTGSYQDGKALDTVSKIKHVILVAGDVDRTLFVQRILMPLQRVPRGPQVTIYASKNDKWIERSGKLWKAPRLGLGGPDILVAPGLVSIDVSSKPTGEQGHDLLGVPDVLRDIHAIVALGLPVGSASRWLRPIDRGPGERYTELR